MLVLSRYCRESIVIIVDGRRVVVTVVEIRGEKCKIGIEADHDISVNRSEIQERLDAGAPAPGWRDGA